MASEALISNGAPAQPSCGSCRFWKARGALAGGAGECKRFPPLTLMLPHSAISGMAQAQTVFPATQAADWCGEFIGRGGAAQLAEIGCGGGTQS